MPLRENHINPCFCVSLLAGTIALSIYDVIYGIAYIFRVMYIEYLQKAYHDYFPAEIPNPTKSDFMSAMFRRGNYILTIICGVLILFATTYLRVHYAWFVGCCGFWLFMKSYLVISYSIFSNALIHSTQSHFQRFGYEILFNIFITIYCMVVVVTFVRETRIELNNTRAIKPINIERGEHEEYLRGDKDPRFNDATSYYSLYPHFFLNSMKNESARTIYATFDAAQMDDTLLQYVISGGSKVEVVPEPEEEEEQEEGSERGKSITIVSGLKSTDSINGMEGGESKMSVMPSEMSIPPDFDKDFENYDMGGYDKHMFSKSQSIMKFSTVANGAAMENHASTTESKVPDVAPVNVKDKKPAGVRFSIA